MLIKENEELKLRLEKTEQNAKAKVSEASVARGRDVNWYKRNTHVPVEPIFIASTEDIGTLRARLNHVDAAIHFCIEQEKLKAMGAPI